ncbi:hypothetical protein Daura_24040 [Dactylosporangium aurantiacum]|uniref:Uncharacterized protein n=1 Tax=Dactylosporangium aurantiacum TaxID=35754 RepID=A0A9Q9IU14_9ACTN|nr:hypothetical protein [Dactylosporangium aurantiacum]MDG6103837.1 hypothetical protein [Dactylosporangium aurantiacum]UWZ58963.1 hypothetical protein Daura_24040 [Dactylosporangium aurantiacum]
MEKLLQGPKHYERLADTCAADRKAYEAWRTATALDQMWSEPKQGLPVAEARLASAGKAVAHRRHQDVTVLGPDEPGPPQGS